MEVSPAYPPCPPSSQCFFQPLPIETKEHNEPGGAANQWDSGAALAQAIASKRGELLAGAAAHRRKHQRSVKCSWESPDPADLHFTREFVAFLFASLLLLPFYLTFLLTLRLDALNMR